MYLSCLLIDMGDNPDRPRPGRLWLRNLYRVHQRLCMAFPSDDRKRSDPLFLRPYAPDDFPEQRHLADRKNTEVSEDKLRQVHAPRDESSGFLFRVDPLPGGRAAILVQSAMKPDWEYAFHNAKHLLYLAASPEVKPFDPRFAADQILRFRLVANPTKKVGVIQKGTRQSLASGELKERKGRHGKRVAVPNEQLHEWLAQRAEKAGFSFDRDSTAVQSGYVYVNKSRDDKGQRLRSARYEGVLKVSDSERFRDAVAKGIGPGKAFGFGLLSVGPAG